jgi:anti-sigma factor RsiW
MKPCVLVDAPDIELYFYGELDANERARVEAHLRACDACRQRLDDLHAIRRALAARPAVEAPPAGDWSGFMRRLDESVSPVPRDSAQSASSAAGDSAYSVYSGARVAAALAAMLLVTALGVFVAARLGHAPAATQNATAVAPAAVSRPGAGRRPLCRTPDPGSARSAR